MLPQADTTSTCSCVTLRWVLDERGVTVPAGVILSDPYERRLSFRLPAEHERIDGLLAGSALPYLRAAQAQIEGWLRRGELPYETEPIEPLSEPWWEHVRKLMRFRVRIDPPRPVDCHHPGSDLESLYQSVVSPTATASGIMQGR